ncbi:MAG: DNA replication/repair protein RecF [Hyphomicrobiales bacterium]
MRVRRLTLDRFRNYGSVRLDSEGAPVVLTGSNGAGKTNLLEALSLLSPGRGLRGEPYETLARDAGEAWAIAAEIEGPDGEAKIGTAWQSSSGEARQVKIDGTQQRGSGAIARHVRVLWLTPAMDRLFTASAGERRRFLDRLVAAFDPEHGTRVNQFERAMRERNRLLEDAEPDRKWLSAVEEQMAEGAVAIAAARRLAVEALSTYVAETRTARSGGAFPWVSMTIVGEIEDGLASSPAVKVEDDYRRTLQDSRRLDQAAGRTLNGPHRADLQVTHGPRGMAAEKCSTGEQKALLIGITLAHARAVRDAFSGFVPLLLLDEVVAHLDRARREGLFEELAELGAQAWMTGTDAALFAGFDGKARFMTVEAGQVAPCEAPHGPVRGP